MDVKVFFERFNKTYLEIGPLDNPKLKRPDFNVFYLDYNDTSTIKKLYDNTYAKMDKIVDIDFPTHGRSYIESTNGRKFDGVYSSHVIEHTTDFIGHLLDVADVLNEGGEYFIVLPDKSHYADYFRQNTTFREVFGAYMKSSPIMAGVVADSTFNTTYQYGVSDFHKGEVSLLGNILRDNQMMDRHKEIYNCSDPVSLSPMCHKWVFSYISLLEIIRDCLRFNLIPFCVEQKECTSDDTNYNIFLVLKKCSSILSDETMRVREIIKLQAYIEAEKGLKSPLNYILNNIQRKTFYVYGAGAYGRMVCTWLQEECGESVTLIVSDKERVNPIDGYNIKHISDIEINNKTLFVVAVRQLKNRIEIEDTLNKLTLRKWEDYVCV